MLFLKEGEMRRGKKCSELNAKYSPTSGQTDGQG
jgi:hypothetical protein